MIVGTLAAVALGAIAGSAGSMNSAVRGTLVFERGTPSSFGSPTEASVYAVVLPGGEASRLIQNARDPSVSRDGASIAFTRSGIWAAASTGTNERQLT
ncbi:MAG: hypothetical protein ACJ76O_00965, partial [Gaiellaceae bacterium]